MLSVSLGPTGGSGSKTRTCQCNAATLKSYTQRLALYEKKLKLIKRIDTYRDEMVNLQKRLTAIPALSPKSGGDGEGKKAAFLTDYLTTLKFTSIETLTAAPSSASTRPLSA